MSGSVLDSLIQLKDENYCKLLEYTLKLIFRIQKHSEFKADIKDKLLTIVELFDKNSNLVSMFIKLTS